MIQLAWENGIEPMLVLTPFTQGVFNNQLIQTLVEEESVRENVITNLLKVVEEKGYVGVDVDFGICPCAEQGRICRVCRRIAGCHERKGISRVSGSGAQDVFRSERAAL